MARLTVGIHRQGLQQSDLVLLDGRGSVAYFHLCWDVLFCRAVDIRHWVHRPGRADAPGKSELDLDLFTIVSDWSKGVNGLF